MIMSSTTLTWNEALSGIFGSISLASWIFLLIPQLMENYQQRSAQGISLTFVCIWFLGDIANLVGAIWAGLVPTVIAIAIYFCFSDAVLISQCLYYNALNRRAAKLAETEPTIIPANGHLSSTTSETEQTPLLPPTTPSSTTKPSTRVTDITNENLGLPGSRRRSSTTSQRQRRGTDDRRDSTLPDILEEPRPTRAWIKNALSILVIVAVGTAGWALAWRAGAWQPTPSNLAFTARGNHEIVEQDPWGVAEPARRETPLGAEILGYASAVLYLGARIPQIVKNQRERSCDGLSLLFFLLSLMGNATYGAGVSDLGVDEDERKEMVGSAPD